MTTQHRKQNTHEKIQLGGLIVKAGLRDAEKAIILGALVEVSNACLLYTSPSPRDRG